MPDVELAQRAIAAMVQVCSGLQLMLCASLVLPVGAGYGVVSVLVDGRGERARQAQLHRCERYPWMSLGDQLSTVDLPWGRLAMITGDDMVFPELVKVAALGGRPERGFCVGLRRPDHRSGGLRRRRTVG